MKISMVILLGVFLARFSWWVESVQGQESSRTNINASAGNTLTDTEIKTLLGDYIDADKLGVGLAVGIVDEHGTRVICHGKLDNGTDADVDGDTVFEIGSITKVFTALLLQDMVERGEMKLDDPVQKYLPHSVKMPTYQGKQITLLHLATHTSGLPRVPDNLPPPGWKDPDPEDAYTVEQLYAFLPHYQLRQAPGTREEYSNLGMQLLGHVIELKAGKDYETLVLERICRPLEMDSTRIILTPELKSRLAIGHAMPGGRAPGDYFADLPGAGGLRSTANDLLRFVSAYTGLAPSPLSPTMQKAEAFHSLEDGSKRRLAWGQDKTVFAHDGGTYGYMTVLAFDAKSRRGVIVLSNCRNSGIVDAIWPPLLDGRSPKPTHALPADPTLYDRYAGQYQTDKGGICSIRREGERLLYEWIGRPGQRGRYPGFELFLRSESVFANDFWGVQAVFRPATNQQTLKFVLTSLGPYSGLKDPVTLTRISTDILKTPAPVHLDSRTYDDFVGQYRKSLLFGLIHLGPVLSISHETNELGDHLVASARGLPGENVAEFFPESETGFIVNPMSTADEIRLTFVRNKKDTVTGIIVDWNGSRHSGSRISNQPAK